VRLTLGAARNYGLERATTPFVLTWDADDVMLPGTLSFLEAAIAADPRVVAFGTAIAEDESGIRHRWPRRWMVALAQIPRVFAVVNAVWSLFPTTGATIMRAGAVRDAGGYADADSGEDWCLGVALAFRGRIGWSERPGRIYLLHDRSMWAQHMTAAHQRQHARAVRDRIRGDPRAPQLARRLLPLIAIAQAAAIGVHEVVRRLRRTAR
jgi:glycosyltransferase involved in cell wall biosynthesis